ncbi:unnamed protein product [Victoria cruziana]
MHPTYIHEHICYSFLLIAAIVASLVLPSQRHVSLASVTYIVPGNLTNSGLSYNRYKSLAAFTFSRNVSSCEVDLNGVGSLNKVCLLNTSITLNNDLHISGMGDLVISPHVSIACRMPDCLMTVNMLGNVILGEGSSIIAGSVIVNASNLSLGDHASISTSSLGGQPPSQTSGTPLGLDGAGGGHGGRGALCLKGNTKKQEDVWGGDVYGWSTLSEPWNYGSKGGTTSSERKLGGNGGGRILIKVKDLLYLNGSLTAEGGGGGMVGGGGSGGSIIVHSLRLKGNGAISAAGGTGWGGGGGGRISLDCYSIQEDVKITSHGGKSLGCPENAGAAGTIFDSKLLSLRVSNNNISTQTETPLLDFPTSPIWSNVFVESRAKVVVPLRWTRVQVRGQIRLLNEGCLSFGLADYPFSEFELVAEELLLSDSSIKVYGAFRVSIKMLLMWNSQIQIDGGGDAAVAVSVLEVRNLIVLRENSVISSNANLGVYGQGLLKLSGHGDAIKSQQLFLYLFYNIDVGPGSLLRAPLNSQNGSSLAVKSYCETQTCPTELISPPEDCHVNTSLSFTLQICRVEDLVVSGLVIGSIIHIHRARTVVVNSGGVISASGLGCIAGIGKGQYGKYGAGSGAGHGGRGGAGFYDGRLTEGGQNYGDANLPCELGSGNGDPTKPDGHVAGGGLIVMGSTQWPLSKLDIYGSMDANGESVVHFRNQNDSTIGGLGGGSGGSILLFLQMLLLGSKSILSISGGKGGPFGGGGGGGGRIHFDWSNIATGDEYVPLAIVNSTINLRGGSGSNDGLSGEDGTITGNKCPKGLYGTFCNECPVGTYKDADGSEPSLCTPCSLDSLPNRAVFIYVRGGVSQPSCPYKCLSEKYRMPNCYTPLEELVHKFGGPWFFGIILIFSLVLLALLLNAIRSKFVVSGSSYGHMKYNESRLHHSFPHLLSLVEVHDARRNEETQNHVHRMYFMGPNTFREPWHLPHSPPDAIVEIVYEDAFNRFIDDINSIAAYEWWEGSVHSILSMLAYPCAWSWKQWRRRKKIHRLQEYVKSEYDHSCLRSCRSRALYKGMKVGSTPDLVIAYIDFFLGGDEKRLDTHSGNLHRFPLCIMLGGDGSYMSPYNLHSDMLLTRIVSQHIPSKIWDRLVDGINAQLRTVRQARVRATLVPVIDWINNIGNPQLEAFSVRADLGWFQVTASGYYQLGLLITIGNSWLQNNSFSKRTSRGSPNQTSKIPTVPCNSSEQMQQHQQIANHFLSRKRISGGVSGGILNSVTVESLDYRRGFLFPFSLLLQNTKPIDCQDTVLLAITILLLGDFTLTLLMLLQFYWISLGTFLSVLLIFPLSLLSSFPAGLSALFSQVPQRCSSLARVYALWNATSLSNILVSFICGLVYYGFLQESESHQTTSAQTFGRYIANEPFCFSL